MEQFGAEGICEAASYGLPFGDKTVTNYLHGVTGVAVDFPTAEKLAA